MKKLLLSLLFVTAIFSLSFSQNAFSLSEEESLAVLNSEEVINLKNKNAEFIQHIEDAISNGSSLDEIRAIAISCAESKNYEDFYNLVFGSVEQGVEFIESFSAAKSAFLSKNTFIQENPDVFSCSSCDKTEIEVISYFFDNFDNIKGKNILNSNLEITKGEGGEKPVCGSYWNQVKLIACMGLCSAYTVGIGTAACGWGCWCEFCKDNSKLAKSICGS